MSAFTKRAMMQSFLHLLEKKQLEKITVRDVVDDCGVNRNTFYYYFRDIYAMLEDLCQYAMQKLPENGTLADTAVAFFKTLGDFSQRYPKAARNLYLSLGRDGLERCFADSLDRALIACMLEGHSKEDAVRERLLCAAVLMRHALIGVAADWLGEERSELESACTLLRTMLEGFSTDHIFKA